MSEKKDGRVKSRKQVYLASFIVCIATTGLSATSVYASNDLVLEPTTISSDEITESSAFIPEVPEETKESFESYSEESQLYTESQEGEKTTITINSLSEPLLADGIFGECYWRVYSTDSEVILELSIPWHRYRSSITRIVLLDGVKAPEDASYMFAGYTIMTEIEGIEKLNCSNTVDMSYMFQGAGSLVSLNIDSWNMRAVTNTSSMFSRATSLTSLNLNSWEMSAVSRMDYMFANMAELMALNISDWDISSVTSTSMMFFNTPKLTSLDVSDWNTSALQDISGMFSATGIQELDLNKWNTESILNMQLVFAVSHNLTTLKIDQWQPKSATNMEAMFFYCSGLSELDLSQWDTSSVVNMNTMFMNAGQLRVLDLGNWNTENVQSMGQMFFYVNINRLTLGENFRFLADAALAEISSEGYTGQWIGENTKTIFPSSNDFMKNYAGQADTYIWESKSIEVTLPMKMLFYSQADDITHLTSNMYQFTNDGYTDVRLEIVNLKDELLIEEIQQLSFGDVELIRNGENVLTANTPETLTIVPAHTSVSKDFNGSALPLTNEVQPKFQLIFKVSLVNEVE